MKRKGSVSIIFGGLIVAGLMLVGSQAAAAPVVCNSVSDDRHMTLDPVQGDAACAGVGSGMPANKSFHEGLGLLEIEKLEDGVNMGSWFKVLDLGDTYGSIEILDTTLFSKFSNVHVAFKFGHQTNPDWMSYSLNDVFSASWRVFKDEPIQGLSNVALWGKKSVSVPAPATLGLFALGLVGLTVSRWRKQQ